MTYRRLRLAACVCAAIGFVAAGAVHGADDAAKWGMPPGVHPTATYIGDVFTNVSGGKKRGTTYVGNLYLGAALDGERLLGAPGLKAFIDGLWIHGGQPSDLTGDAQGSSDLAAARAVTLYEAWVQRNSAHTSVLAGRYDLNTEFDQLQSAGLFLGSSFGIGAEFGQSGVAGPSIFPFTSVGVRWAVAPWPGVVWRTAVLDGEPFDRPGGPVGAFKGDDGLLIVTEAAFINRPPAKAPVANPLAQIGRLSSLPSYDDKLAVGLWHYTATFDDLSALDAVGDPVARHGSSGAYVIADRLLFGAAGDAGTRVSGFVQLGISDRRVERFASYVGAGVVAAGPFPGRPDDQMGLGVARAYNGSHYIASQHQAGVAVTRAETAVEFTYLAQIDPRFSVQPDIQYIIHPNTDPTIKNATALQLRFELDF